MFMVVIMVSKNLLLHGLSYTNYNTHCWRPWRGCSMNVFLQRVVEVHIMKNLEMKILVLVMDFMIISAMVMVVVVVDGVLTFVIGMKEDMDVIVMCILMMKIQVLGKDFMMISEVMVVVGVQVTMIDVLEENADMVVVFTLMMKRKFIVDLKMGNMMIMTTVLLAMGVLDSIVIAVEVLVMMEDIIVVVTIGMIRIALIEST